MTKKDNGCLSVWSGKFHIIDEKWWNFPHYHPKRKKKPKKKVKVWQFFAITQATEPVLRGWGNELKVSWKYWVKERTVLGILY